MTSVATGRDIKGIAAKTKSRLKRKWAKTTACPPFRPLQPAKLQTTVPRDGPGKIGSAVAFDIATALGRLEIPCPLQQATRSATALDRKVLLRLEKHLAV